MNEASRTFQNPLAMMRIIYTAKRGPFPAARGIAIHLISSWFCSSHLLPSTQSLNQCLLRASQQNMPKRSAGCRTCVRRRVKCDRHRPHCRRCQRANLGCDGPPIPVLFLDETNTTADRVRSKSAVSRHHHLRGKRSVPLLEPLQAWNSTVMHQFKDANEWRAFQFFSEKTVSCLSSYFGMSNHLFLFPLDGLRVPLKDDRFGVYCHLNSAFHAPPQSKL